MPPLTTGSGSFSYRKLKKLPPPQADVHERQLEGVDDPRYLYQQHSAAIQDYYRQAAAAIVARRGRNRPSYAAGGGGGRRRRRRLRISGLARLLRRKAAAVGGKVRASVAKVVGRLREGGPYVGDLFAGNYLFLQVTPSSAPSATTPAALDKGFLPYYYGVKNKQAAAAAAVQQGLIRA